MNTIHTKKQWANLLKNIDSADNDTLFDIACHLEFGLIVDGKVIVKENPKKAFKIYEQAYKNGDLNAMIRMADYYSEGKFCKINLDFAIQLYNKGIEMGSGMAANNLATVYRDIGDLTKSFELYQVAQDLNKSDSLELAYCYYYGIGTENNRLLAFEILERIAEDSSIYDYSEIDVEHANLLLGIIYLEGQIVEKSIEKARECLERANIENDNPFANDLLLMIGKSVNQLRKIPL